MTDQELRFTQAQLRMELRDLEVEIQRVQHEQRFYRRLGFGQDLQDVQVVELQARKRDCQERLRRLEQRSRRGESQVAWTSWLVMSPLMVLLGLQSLVGRLRPPALAD